MSKVVTIEIGLYFTKVSEVDYKKKNTKVYRSFIFSTPENTIEDGYIRDKNSFSEELRRQLKENRFNNKNLIFTVASSKILSREVTIPAVKENRIMSIVKAEAAEYFPMDISEHELTYSVMEKLPETKQLKIMVYAAPTNLVRNYYGMADLLGVNLMALEYVGNSLYQVLRHLPGEGTKFVVQVNQQNTMVSILRNGALLLQRNVNFGVASLVDVVSSFADYSGLSPLECYRMLCAKRFIRRSAVDRDSLDEDIASEVADDVTDEVFRFISSISRILEYYNVNEQEHKIDRIYLLGRGTKIAGLLELVSSELAVPAEAIMVLPGITFKKFPEAMKEHLDEMYSCSGAALNPVNFIPADLIQKTMKKDNLRLYLLLLALVIVASGTLIFTGFVSKDEAKEEQERLTAERAEYEYINAIYQKFLNSVNAKGEADTILNNAGSNNTVLNELIAELEKKLPADCIVQSLSVTEESIFMSFVTNSKETAAQLIVLLRKIPYIGTVAVSGIAENEDAETGSTTVTFGVSMTWNPLSGEVTGDE